jgi:hypothetical protein
MLGAELLAVLTAIPDFQATFSEIEQPMRDRDELGEFIAEPRLEARAIDLFDDGDRVEGRVEQM